MPQCSSIEEVTDELLHARPIRFEPRLRVEYDGLHGGRKKKDEHKEVQT